MLIFGGVSPFWVMLCKPRADIYCKTSKHRWAVVTRLEPCCRGRVRCIWWSQPGKLETPRTINNLNKWCLLTSSKSKQNVRHVYIYQVTCHVLVNLRMPETNWRNVNNDIIPVGISLVGCVTPFCGEIHDSWAVWKFEPIRREATRANLFCRPQAHGRFGLYDAHITFNVDVRSV